MGALPNRFVGGWPYDDPTGRHSTKRSGELSVPRNIGLNLTQMQEVDGSQRNQSRCISSEKTLFKPMRMQIMLNMF